MTQLHDVIWPAEWEPHDAVWIGWPHNTSDWSPKFAAIPWVFAEMVRHLNSSERVMLLVGDAAHEARAIRVLDNALPGWRRQDSEEPGVRMVRMPTDRGWTRDFLPFFVRTSGGGAVLHCAFTGWGRYPNHKLDHAAGEIIAARVAREQGLHLENMSHDGELMTLEGGALDGNGQGALLCTEECLLDPVCQVRNIGMCAKEYEEAFARYLGARTVIWLGRGVQGDDTHGHVDDFCRFVGTNTVLLCKEENGNDPNHAAMEENRERLEGVRLENGSGLEILRLPMPAPVHFGGMRLPASYGNFYIGNSVVLVPTFNDPQDRVALGVISDCFPERRVVGVHAVDLVLGLGAIHCLTHEQPRIP